MIGRARRFPLVLAYHGVGTVAPGEDPRRLVVSPARLEEHVRLLRGRGYALATAEALLDGPLDGRLAVLTFDDGFADWLDEALPLLRRLGARATFYVCPGWLGAAHPDVRGRHGRLLDEAGVRALADAGMEIGSHSLTHRDLRTLDDADLDRELRESRARIEAITGRACRTFAYPFGLADDRAVAAVAAAGYELAFGWGPGPWRPLRAPRLPGPPRHGARRLSLKLAGVRRPAALP